MLWRQGETGFGDARSKGVCVGGRGGVGGGVKAKMNRLVCFLIGGGQWMRLGGE